MLKTLKTLFKQDKEKFVIPKSVQAIIPIKTIWEDGIFLVGSNKYAKTFKFEDINYSVASREDKEAMFLEYSELLNALDSGATTKITVNNRRLNKTDFEQTILIPMAEDGLDNYRKEYNKMLLDKVTGANSIVQDKYVTVSVCKKNIEEAVHIVRMENQMEKKVKNYSLGMKQRLGIAMALARFPKLLILDEPTNGLDPAGIEEMRELIKTLPKQYGMTVMISSHILSEIDQMATVVGIINQGCLIFQERMSVLDMQREPQIVLRTSDNNRTYQLLKKTNPQRTADGLQIGALSDEQIGAVVQCLCSNGISVYRVEEHRESLEDIFLNLTGKELTL